MTEIKLILFCTLLHNCCLSCETILRKLKYLSLVTDGASSMLLPGSCSWSRLWSCRRRHEEGRKGRVRLLFLLLCLSNAFTANWASSRAELPQFRLNSPHWFYDWRGHGELGDQSQNGAVKWQWQLFLQSSLIRAFHMGKMRGQLSESLQIPGSQEHLPHYHW